MNFPLKYRGGVGYIISWVSEPGEPLMPYISFIRDHEMDSKTVAGEQQNGTYYTKSLFHVTQDPKTCAHCHIGFNRCLHCGESATAQIFKEQMERNPYGC